MFNVYENNKPAKFSKQNVSSIWSCHSYSSFKEAFIYAKNWLGDYDTIPDNWDGKPYDYNGYGDMIEIRE